MKARIFGLDFLCAKEQIMKALQPELWSKAKTWPSPSHSSPRLAQVFQELWLCRHQQLPTARVTVSAETPGTNTQSLGEQDTKNLQVIMAKKQWAGTPAPDTSPQSPSSLISDSPACEVYLVTTKMKKGVWEHGADLLKQTGHKLIGAVKDGVDGPICPRRILAQVARSQEVWSTWVIANIGQ